LSYRKPPLPRDGPRLRRWPSNRLGEQHLLVGREAERLGECPAVIQARITVASPALAENR